MPATVTLTSTTLTYGVDQNADKVVLASVNGVVKGYRLWIDKEMMKVYSVNPDTLTVQVGRGRDGTGSQRHSSSAVVTVGSPEQFYEYDPIGAPGSSIPVSPYIAVRTGKVWMAQGDATPENAAYRYWLDVTQTYG